jgi:YVTN family beta-propeller protein
LKPNESNTVSVIDGQTESERQIAIGKGLSGPTDLVSLDYKVYVANTGNDTVSVINTANDKPEPNAIRVGIAPTSFALDGDTIYVLNSNSVSVINYISDSIMVGVTLNIHPYNSGTLTCYKVRIPTNPNLITISIPTNIFLFIDSGTNCAAQPKNNFGFDGWVENLTPNRNSTIPVGDSSGNLILDRYGTFTANFKPLPPAIPPEYLAPLYGIIVSSVIGWSIPSIIGWIRGKVQRRNLKECLTQIGKLDKNTLEEKITRLYVDGKINDSHHQLLINKITEHYESRGSPIK